MSNYVQHYFKSLIETKEYFTLGMNFSFSTVSVRMLLSNKLKFHFLKINVGAYNVLLYIVVFSVSLLCLELLKHFCVIPHKDARSSYTLFYPFNSGVMIA